METPQPSEPHEADTSPEQADSLFEAFYWLLGTDEFADGPADDELRAIEIGNVYTYALEEGIPEDHIDQLYAEALSQAEASA